MESIAHYWEKQGIENGIQQGIELGDLKLMTVAKKMLEKNKPLDEIIDFTGLTRKQIEKLIKS